MTGVQRPGPAARFALLCIIAVGLVLAVVTAGQIAAVGAALALVPADRPVGVLPFAAGPAASALGMARQWPPGRSLALGSAAGIVLVALLAAVA